MTLTSRDDITDKIKSSALLVSLHLGRYNPIKTDRSESNKVLNSHHLTDAKLLKVKKHTLPTADVIQRIEKLDTQIRATLDKFTAPFARGIGLLPATKYLELTAAIRPLFGDRDLLIKQLADDYSLYLDGAKRELNGAFDARDYPPVANVVSRFSHKLDTFPIADPRDSKLNILGEIADSIQNAVADTFREKTESLAPFIRELLLDPLVKFSETLQNPDATFKDSLLGNVLEAAERAEGLNILEDDQIANAVFAIKQYFPTISVDSLRDNEADRSVKVNKANDIIESLDGTVPSPKVVAPRKPRAKKAVALLPCDPVADEPEAQSPEADEPTDEQIHAVADKASVASPEPDNAAAAVLAKLGW